MKNSKFENNLWKFRKRANLKQKDVAYLLGIKNISQISRWEKGERLPSLENAFKLGEIYNCEIKELFPELSQNTKKFILKRKLKNEKRQKE